MNILITGANRGLGRHLVEHGAARGHTLFAGVRNSASQTAELNRLKERYPDQVILVPLDVSDEESVREASALTAKTVPHLDAVINNAGILLSREKSLEELDFEDVELTFRINLFGPMMVLKHFLPLLAKGRRQAIVNVTSESGSYSNAYGADYPYALTKAALNFFSAQLRNHLREQDVKVYAVHPGWIKTDMGTDKAPGDPAETASGILDLLERRTEAATDQVFIDFRGQPMPL